ncbi:MAG TPA: hypothetical protein VFA46_02215 [Actinomycetes bacterium]|jgi:hypothetical protein|nr:hypothetical protein [Actinomycetes bacterium]
MITEYQREAVRFEGGRPVALGGQPLSQATRVVQTGSGLWALFVVGEQLVVVHPGGALRGPVGELRGRLQAMAADQALGDEDREAVASFLPFLGADDPGKAEDVPRSRVEEGVPPTYWLSGMTNSPPGAEPEGKIEEAQPGPEPP